MNRGERTVGTLGRRAQAVARARLGALLVLGLLGAACQGRTVWDATGASSTTRGAGVGGTVRLSDADLAPVDAYISTRNAQWILGDDVEVVASREYFGQHLTVNRATGLVERRDTTTPDGTLVELTYVGAPGAASVTTNPRVLIGTGLTITARRTLRVRLVRTEDARRPVQLRVTARGDASRGRHDDVQQRAPQLVLGGELVASGAGWRWVPFG